MKFIRFLLGTSIIWLPIILCVIAKKITEVITMESIMAILYIAIPILLIILLKINKQERISRKLDD